MSINDMEFYIVWNPGRGLPKVQHDTEDQARREACRLARQHPGEEFIVLRSVGTAVQPVDWRPHITQPPF